MANPPDCQAELPDSRSIQFTSSHAWIQLISTFLLVLLILELCSFLQARPSAVYPKAKRSPCAHRSVVPGYPALSHALCSAARLFHWTASPSRQCLGLFYRAAGALRMRSLRMESRLRSLCCRLVGSHGYCIVKVRPARGRWLWRQVENSFWGVCVESCRYMSALSRHQSARVVVC